MVRNFFRVILQPLIANHYRSCYQMNCTERSHDYATTSILDLFKLGPGPSSSHTIGPMKIARLFLHGMRKFIATYDNAVIEPLRVRIHLYGSLSATGFGHGTHGAAIAGLLDLQPDSVDPYTLLDICDKPGKTYSLPVEGLSVVTSLDDIVCHDNFGSDQLFHPNTILLELLGSDKRIFSEEYYSVGGGFIQQKGFPPEDHREVDVPYGFTCFEEVKNHLDANPGLTLLDLAYENEMVISNMSKAEVKLRIRVLITAMLKSVDNGISSDGVLPGPIGLTRKAKMAYLKAVELKNILIAYINAYCMASSEENAAGMIVVTAPTSGSSGVLPGLLKLMTCHLNYTMDQCIDSMMVASIIGIIIKRNSSISGAEMGCMGEIGTASSIGAAMLAHAAELQLFQIEAAAEIAMEHHLGMTCDPVSGYVQIPCIQRNSMGGVKAYNSYLLALSLDETSQKISFDDIVKVMRQTGKDMDSRYRETALGGLAALSSTSC